MNKMTSGFTLLELLVSLMVLMLFLGGFCYLLLILPKSSLYQSSAAMELHKSADFWFALEKDIKNAGYGITDILPLLTFKAVDIEYSKFSAEHKLNSYWNKFYEIRRTLNIVRLPRGVIAVINIDRVNAGDYAILAENEPITAEPHWAIILVNNIHKDSDNTIHIHFELIEQVPSGNNDFSANAYFVPVEKISYVFQKDKGKIVRIVNDTAIQPFLEDIQDSGCRFCSDKDNDYLRNCIACSIAFKGKSLPQSYSSRIFIPNL